MVEARSISRSFPDGGRVTPVLAPVSLGLDHGAFLAVTGPSGSGKSTLLNLLSGLDQPSAGEVRFRDRPLHRMDGRTLAGLRNQSFGFIFQTPHVLADKTVIENVALPTHYGPPLGRRRVRARCRELLRYVGLDGLEARRPNTLSGGELQRLVFARALVNDPEVIFADEPTGSLDPVQSGRVLDLLRDQAERGRVVVMVTHDQVAARYGNRHLRLEKCGAG